MLPSNSLETFGGDHDERFGGGGYLSYIYSTVSYGHMIKATLCYIQKPGFTLMLYRDKPGHTQEGKWNGLGGKIEQDETPYDCVIREVREESGMHITPQLRGEILFPGFVKQPNDWYCYVYTATEFTGEPQRSNEGKLAWIPNKELQNLHFFEGDKFIFEWLENGRFFHGILRYDDSEHLVEHSVTYDFVC
jgi:8-oxo-dGTP diphosphatase